MTNQTKIEWCNFTVNFWEGCQKVGPGCDNCYAEARDIRFTGGSHWGPGAPRRLVKSGIPKLRKINREAETFRAEHGHWPRVFCSSLSDVFDNAISYEWQIDAMEAIEDADQCRVMMLTKRVGNVAKVINGMWDDDNWPPHVGLMITVVNQAEANRDIPKLLDLKARLGIPWVGLSIEPMLGPVDLTRCAGWDVMEGLHDDGENIGAFLSGVDWVICGGESGHNARPMHPDWARSLRNQCASAGTPFLFKQWGEWISWQPSSPPEWQNCATNRYEDGHVLFSGVNFDRDPNWDDGLNYDVTEAHVVHQRIGKKKAGRLLDGRTHDVFPKALELNK